MDGKRTGASRSERVIIALTLLLVGLTAGYFAGRATATPDGTVAVTVERPPAAEPAEPAEPAAAPDQASPEPMDLNDADLAALTTLPGIGETLAQRILDYREEHGRFYSVQELLNVAGIGEKRLEAIAEYVYVGE